MARCEPVQPKLCESRQSRISSCLARQHRADGRGGAPSACCALRCLWGPSSAPVPLRPTPQAAFSGKASRPVARRAARLIVRAEEKAVAKVSSVHQRNWPAQTSPSFCSSCHNTAILWHVQVDRSKDQLYIGASQSSLAYLDGTLPGVSREASCMPAIETQHVAYWLGMDST